MQCIIYLFDFQPAMGAAPRLLWVLGSGAGGHVPQECWDASTGWHSPTMPQPPDRI